MAYHPYPYINKLITQLQLRERLFEKLPLEKLPFTGEAAHEEATFTRPFITIAREPGSGGDPIGRAVAQKMGFTFVDDQIIEEIARSTKKRRHIIEAVDEKSRNVISDLVHSMLNPDYVDDSKYITELVKVVVSYAYQGNSVILGRGANFMTPFPQGLHVLVTAPYAVRVARAMQYEGHSEKKAKKVIADVEKERAEFVKKYFDHDLNRKNSYDLVINTSHFDVNQARNVILEAFYQKFPRVNRYAALLRK